MSTPKATVRIGKELIEKAMKDPAVVKQLKVIADNIAREAQTMATAEGEDDIDIVVSTGVRPKGRPFAQVSMDADQEYGTYWKPKRAILRRAMERGR